LDAEVPLSSRVQAIKLRLVKCNSVSEIADMLSTITDEELNGLRVDYSAARPGNSSRELAFLHGVRRTIDAEIAERQLQGAAR
jgi:hypothetical protein